MHHERSDSAKCVELVVVELTGPEVGNTQGADPAAVGQRQRHAGVEAHVR